MRRSSSRKRPSDTEQGRRPPSTFPSALNTPPPAPAARGGPRPRGSSAPPSIPGYEIGRELGRGGMGVVWEAMQLGLQRRVALKMIRDGVLAGAEHRNRFRREAKAAARLHHPNIVQIYEFGEKNGHPYFAMELVEGVRLDSKLAEGAQPADWSAGLVELLARAMHYAHRQRVVHRDLKPGNILLTADGTPKVTDFGLAKCLDDEVHLTAPDAFLGTASYTAPEQAQGHTREVGPAADVYALGAILYALLTARPPFQGTSLVEILDQVRFHEPEPPTRLRPEIPADLEAVCLMCLAKDPARRYASAEALAEDLRRFQARERVLAAGDAPAGWRILLAEDDVTARKSLQLLLRLDPRFQVDAVGDGTAALEALTTGTYHLLVTDLEMPGLDGLRLLEAVQRKRLPVAVIVLTGHGDIDKALRAGRKGAREFITKPIDPEQLRQVIDKVLREQLSATTSGPPASRPE